MAGAAMISAQNRDGDDWSVRRAGPGMGWAGIGIFAAVALLGLWVRPLLPPDETRYLSVAWEMWRTGEHLVPHLNGEIYTQKPPLLFWLIDLTWLVLGVNETVARLIGPLFACISIALTMALGRLLWPADRRIGDNAGFVLATTGMFLVYGSMTLFDALLTSTVLVALIGVALAYRRGIWLGWCLFAIGLGLGGLAKGPVVLVHTLPVALLMPVWGSSERLRSFRWWYGGLGIAVVVAGCIVALWLIPAIFLGGSEYQNAILWKQTAGRIAQSFSHQRPWWTYIALVPLMLWPWVWWVPLWRRIGAVFSGGNAGSRLCIIWFGAAFVLFSFISGKQPHYLLPDLPAIALLVALMLSTTAASRAWIVVAMIPLLIVFAFLTLVWLGHVDLMFMRLPDDTGSASWLLVAAVVALLVVIVSTGTTWRSLGAIGPLMIGVFYLFLGAPFGQAHDGKVVAGILKQHQANGVAFVGHYHGEFSFLGRLTSPVDQMHSRSAIAAWSDDHPGGVIFGRMDRSRPEWDEVLRILYRGDDHGVWIVPDEAATGELTDPDGPEP